MNSEEVRAALKNLYDERSDNIVKTIALSTEIERLQESRKEMFVMREKIDEEIVRIRSTKVI